MKAEYLFKIPFIDWYIYIKPKDRCLGIEYIPDRYPHISYEFNIDLFPIDPPSCVGLPRQGDEVGPYTGPWFDRGWWGISRHSYDGCITSFGVGRLARFNWNTPGSHMHFKSTGGSRQWLSWIKFKGNFRQWLKATGIKQVPYEDWQNED